MDERFGVLPEESEDLPERLETLYKECLALVDCFVGAIAEMLGDQPSDHEQAMIRLNLTQQIEGYFHNNIQGFSTLTPPQQIGCFKFLANELRAF